MDYTSILKEFRRIKGFPNYMITNHGAVLGNRVDSLKPIVTRKGYYLVALYKDGKRYYKTISRLVARGS